MNTNPNTCDSGEPAKRHRRDPLRWRKDSIDDISNVVLNELSRRGYTLYQASEYCHITAGIPRKDFDRWRYGHSPIPSDRLAELVRSLGIALVPKSDLTEEDFDPWVIYQPERLAARAKLIDRARRQNTKRRVLGNSRDNPAVYPDGAEHMALTL